MYVHINPNPNGIYVEDCVVRAIGLITNRSWDDVYFHICLQGYMMKNMPSVDSVWGTYLGMIGFKPYAFPHECPNCMTVREFCRLNPNGDFLIMTGSHAVAVMDGNYFDAWDSGDEIVTIAWRREN